jgi:hypothetical protein
MMAAAKHVAAAAGLGVLLLGAAACTSPETGQSATPTVRITQTVTASPSPACPSASDAIKATVAAKKDNVAVGKPVLRSSGDAFFVTVAVSNCTDKPARYRPDVRLIGPLGYLVMLDQVTPTIQPGTTYSATFTAKSVDPAAVAPKHPTVSVLGAELIH